MKEHNIAKGISTQFFRFLVCTQKYQVAPHPQNLGLPVQQIQKNLGPVLIGGGIVGDVTLQPL